MTLHDLIVSKEKYMNQFLQKNKYWKESWFCAKKNQNSENFSKKEIVRFIITFVSTLRHTSTHHLLLFYSIM